jgi:hypothetical protein
MSEARSNRHRGKTTPTLAIPSGNGKNARLQKSVGARPAKADRGVVKRLVPRTSRADPKIRGVPTSRKRRSEPGTNEVRVHAVFRMGGRSRSDAFRVLPTVGSQGSVVEPAGR